MSVDLLRTRVLFLGTPAFAVTCLEAILNDARYEVAAVISQPDRPAGRKMQLKASPVKELALQKGLRVLTPASVNTSDFRTQIAALGCEVAVVVAFGQILGEAFLQLFPLGAVNVHGSLLPRWRGAAPIQRALMAGDPETGVCLQKIVKKLDAGDVIAKRSLRLTPDLGAIQVYEILAQLGAEMLKLEFFDWIAGRINAIAQDEKLVTIAPKIAKSEALLNWSNSAEHIVNQIRGLEMGPQAYTLRPNGGILKLHKARLSELSQAANSSFLPGQVVNVSPDALTVCCGQGWIDLLEVQPESRSRQKISDFLQGYPLKTCDILGL